MEAQIVLVISLCILTTTTVLSQDLVPFTPVTDAQRIGAVCIDGTPAGYFFSAGFGNGANNWHISLEGGGWCFSEETCYGRGYLTSSALMQPMSFNGILSSNQTINPDFFDWNKVYVHYCDGGFFLGDTQKIGSTYHLQLRGARIFDAVMSELMPRGLQTAGNAILTGTSAGGLAVMSHCDKFAALLPSASRAKCLSDSGFIIHTADVVHNYVTEYIFSVMGQYQNFSEEFLQTCGPQIRSVSCLFPEHLLNRINTPIFILDSVFNRFQIQHNLVPVRDDLAGWKDCTYNLKTCKLSHKKLIYDFRNEFIYEWTQTRVDASRGAFVSSCYAHRFMLDERLWNLETAPRLENKTAAQAVGDWYFERDSFVSVDASIDWPVECGVAPKPNGAATKPTVALSKFYLFLLVGFLVLYF